MHHIEQCANLVEGTKPGKLGAVTGTQTYLRRDLHSAGRLPNQGDELRANHQVGFNYTFHHK